MPLPELWFVYDAETAPRFSVFLNRTEAEADYERRVQTINDLFEEFGDEAVYFGQILKKAEVVPVALNNEDEELFELVSIDEKVAENR